MGKCSGNLKFILAHPTPPRPTMSPHPPLGFAPSGRTAIKSLAAFAVLFALVWLAQASAATPGF